MTNEQKLAEWEAINAYVRKAHNAYNETGVYLGMKVPGSILEAIKELVDENKALLSWSLRLPSKPSERHRRPLGDEKFSASDDPPN